MTASPSYTCPRCAKTSYHPKDVEQGYCGNCHDWTSTPPPMCCIPTWIPGVGDNGTWVHAHNCRRLQQNGPEVLP